MAFPPQVACSVRAQIWPQGVVHKVSESCLLSISYSYTRGLKKLLKQSYRGGAPKARAQVPTQERCCSAQSCPEAAHILALVEYSIHKSPLEDPEVTPSLDALQVGVETVQLIDGFLGAKL